MSGFKIYFAAFNGKPAGDDYGSARFIATYCYGIRESDAKGDLERNWNVCGDLKLSELPVIHLHDVPRGGMFMPVTRIAGIPRLIGVERLTDNAFPGLSCGRNGQQKAFRTVVSEELRQRLGKVAVVDCSTGECKAWSPETECVVCPV